uniref:Uncharacterized protein n=1 Tax=Mycena chlorophos TaxID=658473 RepID=A0ABQ0LY91_MYCCL|nr:predicted protein [Mycena chlorophos]
MRSVKTEYSWTSRGELVRNPGGRVENHLPSLVAVLLVVASASDIETWTCCEATPPGLPMVCIVKGNTLQGTERPNTVAREVEIRLGHPDHVPRMVASSSRSSSLWRLQRPEIVPRGSLPKDANPDSPVLELVEETRRETPTHPQARQLGRSSFPGALTTSLKAGRRGASGNVTTIVL